MLGVLFFGEDHALSDRAAFFSLSEVQLNKFERPLKFLPQSLLAGDWKVITWYKGVQNATNSLKPAGIARNIVRRGGRWWWWGVYKGEVGLKWRHT